MVQDRDDLEARVTALEAENAGLRAQLAERSRASGPHVELLYKDDARRGRFARLMLAGGAVAILGGVFASSWFAVLCGLGWLLGGAAVASTIPPSGGDS